MIYSRKITVSIEIPARATPARYWDFNHLLGWMPSLTQRKYLVPNKNISSALINHIKSNSISMCQTTVGIHALVLIQSLFFPKITIRSNYILLQLINTADKAYGRSNFISPLYTTYGKYNKLLYITM